MSVSTLKEKMRDFNAGKTGSVNVTAEDLRDSGDSGSGETAKEAEVPASAKSDPADVSGEATDLHSHVVPSFISDEIDISEEDKQAFLQAIVTGGRYERSFSLFGGKLTGVFRCRDNRETDGIIAWLNHLVNTKKLDARIEYMTMMRDAVLAAQVKSLRGMVNEDFPELPTPYAPTRSEDGKDVQEPGWLGVAAAWSKRPEALISAIHLELQKFERRYWAMIRESGNQNFWKPAASI